MSRKAETAIDALAAPPNDGELLIWPGDRELEAVAASNHRLRRAYRFPVLGQPVDRLLRSELQAGPVIMTGHQPAFIHPGVWVKNVAVSKLAAALGAKAKFIVVDSDAVGRLALRWPDLNDGLYRIASTSILDGFGGVAGASFEQSRGLSAEQWRAILDRIPSQWRCAAQSAMPTFLAGFLAGGAERSGPELTAAGGSTAENIHRPSPDYVDRWISGVRADEAALGIASLEFVRVRDQFASKMGEADVGVASFVGHLLMKADEFAAAYNSALANYRDRRGIRGKQHPIPDLAADAEHTESPFWVLSGTGARQRLLVSRAGKQGLELRAGTSRICMLAAAQLYDDPVGTLARALGDWRIRPRALALTMYARLFASDLFVHGVGGAKYDQITDDIIRRFFQIEPPAYLCVSATLRLALARFGEKAENEMACRRRLRDLRFNPQRCVSRDRTDLTPLLDARERAVEESLRLKCEEPHNQPARRQAFDRIRRANESLLAVMPESLEAARRDSAMIEARLAHDQVAAQREWFLGLYPLERLRRLAESVRPQGGRS